VFEKKIFERAWHTPAGKKENNIAPGPAQTMRGPVSEVALSEAAL
jgi:hypothetical protein